MPDAQNLYQPVKIKHPEPGKLQALHAKCVASTKAAMEAQTEAGRLAHMQVGDRMEDGTIFAGVSPETNAPMYALPADESLKLDFNEAAKRAEGVSVETGREYRVPTKEEMKILYENRAAIGGFDETVTDSSITWYWTGSEYEGNAGGFKAQRFDTGEQTVFGNTLKFQVRLVRN